MFTGLIEEIGAVLRRPGTELAIMAKTILEGLRPGDSVAIDGACMTVTGIHGDHFIVQVSPESFARTTLARLRPGDAVNLERAMAAGSRFGGHFVLGHVDGVGRVAAIQDQGEFSLWRFQAPDDVARYLVPKGSVAVNGISLTVIEPAGDTFGVAVIPTTLKQTTLGMKRPGDAVNLEADVIGKHIYHYVKGNSGRKDLDVDFLSRHGFA
ncbi:MAG TPA: riboflavin synthase [Candidatus Hydrogenedentes bacterium]|nr:riboflavin synthase [Candidatus Hydrogenedentota bacterium]HPC17412.1 riboflavin synthase [Candidatus Hydrogenedentota bacterium]HRT20839.1 riboflavin synthase [Candidatus Hydrogenedentota bacterium]HRT66080.1 riboflavin synthase [Candidatus Hydrogenedentota bacterium]